jgi:hypothetical protein
MPHTYIFSNSLPECLHGERAGVTLVEIKRQPIINCTARRWGHIANRDAEREVLIMVVLGDLYYCPPH